MNRYILILYNCGEIITEYFSNINAAYDKMADEYSLTLDDLKSRDADDLTHSINANEAWVNSGHDEMYAWKLEMVL